MPRAATPRVGLSGAQDRFYFRGQVLPRISGLLADWVLWASAVSGPAITGLLLFLPGRDIKIQTLAAAGLTYASIAFGACITAVVLVLGLAPKDRVALWSTTGAEGSKFSHFSELVFVVTWAATSQVIVILVCLGSMLAGADIPVIPANPKESHVVLLAFSLAAFIYGVLHLFTVISTLSQIAYVTIDEAHRTKARTDSAPQRPGDSAHN